jgi:hypothetical protein
MFYTHHHICRIVKTFVSNGLVHFSFCCCQYLSHKMLSLFCLIVSLVAAYSLKDDYADGAWRKVFYKLKLNVVGHLIVFVSLRVHLDFG